MIEEDGSVVLDEEPVWPIRDIEDFLYVEFRDRRRMSQ